MSGGSLTAAYYGLFGRRIFEDFPEKVLYRNIQGTLVRRILLPPDNLRMLSPFYTRTDILAKGFDQRIFEEKTYADLLQKGQRPFVIINATDISTGTRFEFTQDQFDLLYSDLGTCHIGHAVAASAAFPGAFPPMAMRNYGRGADHALPDWAAKALAEGATDSLTYRQASNLEHYSDSNRRYVHLTDGGVADNLGLLPVIFMLRRIIEGFGPSPDEFFQKAKNIPILTVNAEVKRPRPWDMAQSPVGLVSTLFAAGTTPLSNFSTAQIEYLRLLIENQELKSRLRDEKRMGAANTPEIHFVEVSFDRARDAAEREALSVLPTSLVLPAEDVNRIRGAAREILQEHPAFQDFLFSLSESGR